MRSPNLDAPDAQFFPAQRGPSRRVARQLRRQRCCVFCQYLRCLQADFRRVTTAIRVLLVQSRYDRPDLARVLVRREVQFAVMMAAIHVRLFLYRWGYGGVDATGLVQAFDSQRLELRALIPAAATLRA